MNEHFLYEMDICQAHDQYNTAHQEILVNFYSH